MKGQSEAISVILISGILIGVVGSVYFWGLPLIQKSKDASTLTNTESFMRNLDSKIKFIANSAGRDQLLVNVPGSLSFDPQTDIVSLVVNTQGTIYATDAEIPLARNPTCTASAGVFALNDPDTLCVKSVKLTDKNYKTTYSLWYLSLNNTELVRTYKIDLQSTSANTTLGSQGDTLVIENTGTTISTSGGETLIKTGVQISIV